VDSLDIVWVIVSPGSAHTPRMNVVRYDVTVISELLLADAAFAVLGDDLPIKELSHLSGGA
jgi:hypothetical protein